MRSVLLERPECPLEEGMVWRANVDEILAWGESIDTELEGYSLEELLKHKRWDSWYKEVRRSLLQFGFMRPCTVLDATGNRRGQLKFGDGHHRLAAAIELGWKFVPVEYVFGGPCVSEDSGGWFSGKDISMNNIGGRPARAQKYTLGSPLVDA